MDKDDKIINLVPHQHDDLSHLLGVQIVIDTDSSYIYIGTLERVGREYLAISNVDVHDTADSKATKEHYTHETKKLGPRHNRTLTLVRIARIVSIAKLDDVILF
ncbi:MAG TPA: hypothetical protein VEK08_17440 [Planctomycetota bacterium]|nr:hypothetical protein [Planctomycetota bacterium]